MIPVFLISRRSPIKLSYYISNYQLQWGSSVRYLGILSFPGIMFHMFPQNLLCHHMYTYHDSSKHKAFRALVLPMLPMCMSCGILTHTKTSQHWRTFSGIMVLVAVDLIHIIFCVEFVWKLSLIIVSCVLHVYHYFTGSTHPVWFSTLLHLMVSYIAN